jgi:hypothetical protein
MAPPVLKRQDRPIFLSPHVSVTGVVKNVAQCPLPIGNHQHGQGREHHIEPRDGGNSSKDERPIERYVEQHTRGTQLEQLAIWTALLPQLIAKISHVREDFGSRCHVDTPSHCALPFGARRQKQWMAGVCSGLRQTVAGDPA